MSLMLAACSTTADVTVDETDDTMMEDTSSSEAMVDETSTGAATDTGAMIDTDADVDVDAEADAMVEAGE